MTTQYDKLSTGLNDFSSRLSLPLTQLPFEGDLGSFFAKSGFLYCSVINEGFVVYDERLLGKVFLEGSLLGIIGELAGNVLIHTDYGEYRLYNPQGRSLATVLCETPFTYGYVNQAIDSSSLFLMGIEKFDSNSLFARMNAKTSLYKYTKNSFELDWVRELETTSIGQVILDKDNDVYFLIDNEKIFTCHGLQTEELNWKADISDVIRPSCILEVHPALVGDLIVLIYKGLTLAISTKDGSIVWQREGATASWGLISTDHKVYQLETSLSDSTRSIITVDAISGELLSSYPLFVKDGSGVCIDLAFHNPLHWAITSTHIFIGWSHGLLTAINPDTGEIEWHADLGGENQDPIVSDIVISNNRLYCRTTSSGIENRVSKSWVFEGEGGFGS